MKHHLKRTIRNLHFTLEEFEVKGIFNSHPLTNLNNDSDIFDDLTPGIFFIGKPIITIPELILTDINENRLSQ